MAHPATENLHNQALVKLLPLTAATQLIDPRSFSAKEYDCDQDWPTLVVIG